MVIPGSNASPVFLSIQAMPLPTSALPAPAIPSGYVAVGHPSPLSRDGEAWWSVLAYQVTYDVLGMLIYAEDGGAIQFLQAQESLFLLFALLDHVLDLAADTTPSFSALCDNDLFTLWQTWNQMHTPLQDEAIRPCAWCWHEQHPATPFPSALSSSICRRHACACRSSTPILAREEVGR